MANNILVNSAIVAKESLRILKNNYGAIPLVNRQYEKDYDDAKAAGYDTGDQITIKYPAQYEYVEGPIAIPNNTIIRSTTQTLSQGNVSVKFTAKERTLSVRNFQDKMQAAMKPILNTIDRAICKLADQYTYNISGTVGTYPNTVATSTAAATKMMQFIEENQGVANQAINLVVNPAMKAALVTGNAQLFNNQQIIGTQNRTGELQTNFGLNYISDQNIVRHVNGSQPATGGTVNGAGQSGSNITVNAGTITGTITKGTRIQFGTVYAINADSKDRLDYQAWFIVTADVASGATTIPIYPSIVPSGIFQNVSNSPANADTITIFGSAGAGYYCNFAFQKDAFGLSVVPLAKLGEDVKQYRMQDEGLSIMVTDYSDGKNYELNTRLDVLWCVYPLYTQLSSVLAA